MKTFEKYRIIELNCVYENTFMDSLQDPKHKAALEEVVEEINTRSFQERMVIYQDILFSLKVGRKRENSEYVKKAEQMKEHYLQHILN